MIMPATAQTTTAATRISRKLRWIPASVLVSGETPTWTRRPKKKPEPNQPTQYAPNA